MGGNYTFPLSDSLDLTLGADYNHNSSVQIVEGLSQFRRTTENLSSTMTLAFDNGLSLSLWGRNLTDDAHITTLFPSVAQAGSLSGYRNQPRTYWASARFKF